ncbi:restriction endonuclease subunit S [Undibacterium sp.]|uniref:restriction endonuclease subunit S n=1 Tax=Undibacterium sp. TaxID=1914977 RepID=UPI0025E16121|nr:restriction endonuclease subunit S [Undibacterium sp.]
MKSNYKRLGNYIKEVKVRNTELKAQKLLGINIDKFFMPSVANIVGTDMSVYKIVKKHQFACNRMHVGRDYRLPISMSKSDEEFMVSPAYDVFEITDTKTIDPEYLMMWFSRREFDRNAWFYTDADVRGGLHWKAFCDMELPIPSLDKQKEIVKEYKLIQNRIALNQQLIQKLEETAQAIYKQWFVDFEFPDENGQPYKSNGGALIFDKELEMDIPEGWKNGSIKDFSLKIRSGGTPSRDEISYWNSKDIPWLKTGEIANKVLVSSEEYISSLGMQNSSAKLLPVNTVLVAMYGEGKTKGQSGYLRFEATVNQACCAITCENETLSGLLYYFFRTNQERIASLANGGAQPNLSKELIENIQILKPTSDVLKKHPFVQVINHCENIEKENMKLNELKDILLSKLATIEN